MTTTCELSPIERECVVAMAENGMRPLRAANAIYMHRNTMVYHLRMVEKKTGLDPRDFYDLGVLLKMATEEEGET